MSTTSMQFHFPVVTKLAFRQCTGQDFENKVQQLYIANTTTILSENQGIISYIYRNPNLLSLIFKGL